MNPFKERAIRRKRLVFEEWAPVLVLLALNRKSDALAVVAELFGVNERQAREVLVLCAQYAEQKAKEEREKQGKPERASGGLSMGW